MKIKYDKDMDREMIPLCNSLNKIKGIRTTFCCCGHGDLHEFYLTLNCSNIKSLKYVLKCFDDWMFITEAEHEGPLGDPAKDNEISIRISFRKDYSQLSKQEAYHLTMKYINRVYLKLHTKKGNLK